MQSRDRTAPSRRAQRFGRGPPPPPPPTPSHHPAPADHHREPRVRRGRTLSMQVTYSKRARGGGRGLVLLLLLSDAARTAPDARPPRTPLSSTSTRRRPLSATSIMTPAHHVHRNTRPPAVVLSRKRDRPRYIIYPCVRVCVSSFVYTRV